MVGIIWLSSFHWFNIHGSRMVITHIKCDSRTLFVVLNIQGGKSFKVFFLETMKNMIRVSGNKAPKC